MREYDAPLWVNVVYKALGWMERHVCIPLDNLALKRFALMDRHCQCDNCIDRRDRMSRLHGGGTPCTTADRLDGKGKFSFDPVDD